MTSEEFLQYKAKVEAALDAYEVVFEKYLDRTQEVFKRMALVVDALEKRVKILEGTKNDNPSPR